jgi:hypothetical protein
MCHIWMVTWNKSNMIMQLTKLALLKWEMPLFVLYALGPCTVAYTKSSVLRPNGLFFLNKGGCDPMISFVPADAVV